MAGDHPMTAPRLAPLIEDYLAVRRRLGFQLDKPAALLAGFARYADEVGHQGPVTTDLTLRWVLSSGSGSEARAARLTAVRGFARYRASIPEPRSRRRGCWAAGQAAASLTSTPTARSPPCWVRPACWPPAAGVSGAHPRSWRPSGFFALAAIAAQCRPGRGCRLRGPNSSRQKITSGSPASGVA